MADPHDAQNYTANGPSSFGFRTGGANIEVGAELTGLSVGVHGAAAGHDDGSGGIIAGVFGESVAGYGVRGRTTADEIAGVWGLSVSGPGVQGDSTSGAGVKGEGRTGVRGFGREGGGVSGESDLGTGVAGYSSSSFGVEGIGVIGVRGRSETHAGVSGESGSGAGVEGMGHTTGGEFASSHGAQLHLIPQRRPQPPEKGRAGDLLVLVKTLPRGLEEAELWFCVRGSAEGTTAMWGQVDFSQFHS